MKSEELQKQYCSEIPIIMGYREIGYTEWLEAKLIELSVATEMPTEEEIVERAKERYDYLEQLGYPLQVLVKYKDAIIETGKWFSNRMGGRQ